MNTSTQALPRAARLAAILLLVLTIQGLKIQRPYFGHFASYQLVSASIARNMIREHFTDLLSPKTDLLLYYPKKLLHLNQYPVQSLLAAAGQAALGGSLEEWGRGQAILFHLLSILLMYGLARRLWGESLGELAAFFYGLSPLTLIYGQSFMSESFAVFCLLLAVSIALERLRPEGRIGIWSSVLGLVFSLALVTRIHFGVWIPLFYAVLFSKLPRPKRPGSASLFSLCAFGPPVLWYGYTYFAGLGADNLHTNLFVQLVSDRAGAAASLPLLEYLRRIFDLFSQRLLTPVLFPFLLAGIYGLASQPKTRPWLLLGLGLSLSPLVLFSKKVWNHDFYLSGNFPALMLIAVYGLDVFLRAAPLLNARGFRIFLFATFLAASARNALHPLYRYPPENESLLPVARSAQLQSREEDLFIVVAKEPAPALYYLDRAAWNMDLSAVGKPLSDFLKNPSFSRVNPAEVQKLEWAMRSPVTWLNDLRARGARYFLAFQKDDLARAPELLAYLQQYDTPLTQESDPYCLFRLNPVPAAVT